MSAGTEARLRTGVEVRGDLFGIAERIREIDDGYFILRRGGRYEVHNRKDRDSYCLTLPFEELDARTVDYVRKTRAERAQALFDEMERENEALRRAEIRAQAERATVCAEELLAGREVSV